MFECCFTGIEERQGRICTRLEEMTQRLGTRAGGETSQLSGSSGAGGNNEDEASRVSVHNSTELALLSDIRGLF